MSLSRIGESLRFYSNLIDNGNADSTNAWSSSVTNQEVFYQNSHSLRPLICRPYRLWHRIMLCRFTRKVSCCHLVLSICLLVTIIILYLGVFSDSAVALFSSFTKRPPPVSVFHCSNTAAFLPHDHTPSDNVSSLEGILREEPKVLLFTETQYSRHGKAIAELLVANRIKYKLEVLGKSLPLLTDLSKGKYGAIVFENIERYLAMDQWNRELLDKYLLKYRVGIIGFFPQHGPVKTYAKLHNFPLYITSSTSLANITLNGDNPVLRLTRAGDVVSGFLQGGYNWSLFIPNHPTYLPLEWAYDSFQFTKDKRIFAVLDTGKFDGIQRVFFGGGIQFWLHRLLLLDSLSYLSHGRLSVSLERFIIVDIDDVFVGPKGNRMNPSDVQALIEAQEKLQRLIPDFKFNLGFSGKFFKCGTSLENKGDELLLKHVDKFRWFGHMWSHTQPHKIESVEKLVSVMEKNKEFATQHGIPTDSGYSVAPHHSGVYPVHEALYQAWKGVWNIRVTSTEEYPHLRPARLRRGFIHRNIMVLPRQTCGLYTHTSFLNKYPGGREVLEKSIQGGELFQTIVSNPINIFMTHQNNYANDRLALFTFETVIKFLQCWTNLKLLTAPPLQLGEKYFHLHPHETDPVWGNPCLDHRHMEIWSHNKTCTQLPKFLVIGPQKTGTTALYTFLAMHPTIIANSPSPETYEEIQFFNGKNYYKGIDWYMKFFPASQNSSTTYLFEKSATYFDGEAVPKRVQSLLPSAQLVTIIIPPEKRAYSWYHHMRAHSDPTSLSYSFFQVITATSESPRPLRDLKNKCLNPGMYAKNLERWLSFFPASQISIIDGEELRSNPVVVMNNLQKFLNIQPFFNYTEHLRFDKRKGFFCQVIEEDRTKCLGRGKGRQYPSMEEPEMKLLQEFYRSHNIALEKLLVRLNYPVPSWLYQQLQGT